MPTDPAFHCVHRNGCLLRREQACSSSRRAGPHACVVLAWERACPDVLGQGTRSTQRSIEEQTQKHSCTKDPLQHTLALDLFDRLKNGEHPLHRARQVWQVGRVWVEVCSVRGNKRRGGCLGAAVLHPTCTPTCAMHCGTQVGVPRLRVEHRTEQPPSGSVLSGNPPISTPPHSDPARSVRDQRVGPDPWGGLRPAPLQLWRHSGEFSWARSSAARWFGAPRAVQ